MINNEEEVQFIHDEDGVWRIDPWGKSLIEPSQKWYDKNTYVPEIPEPTQEERIEILKQRQDITEPYVERIKTATEVYEENKDKSELSLDDLKALRIGKLKEECSNAIYDGFDSLGKYWGFGANDQANFTQQLLLIVAGSADNIQWKTKSDGVVEITVLEFKQVCSNAETHKRNQQFKYWTLEQQILTATDKETIKLIEWGE